MSLHDDFPGAKFGRAYGTLQWLLKPDAWMLGVLMPVLGGVFIAVPAFSIRPS